MKTCKYLLFCIKLTFFIGRCIHAAMAIMRQHIFLIMLVTTALLFSMAASHCALITKVADTTTSSSLFFSHNQLAEDSLEDSHILAASFLLPEALICHSSAPQYRLHSTQLTLHEKTFYLPQIYFDIFVPPQVIN